MHATSDVQSNPSSHFTYRNPTSQSEAAHQFQFIPIDNTTPKKHNRTTKVNTELTIIKSRYSSPQCLPSPALPPLHTSPHIPAQTKPLSTHRNTAFNHHLTHFASKSYSHIRQTQQTTPMPPKNLSPLPGSQNTPSNAQLAQQRESLLETGVVKMTESSPPSPSKELPSPPDTTGSSAPIEAQGMIEPAAKQTAGRKRRAATTTSSGDDTGAEPTAKRKRAAAAAAAAATKKPAVKRKSPKTPKIVVEDLDSEKEAKAKLKQPLAPLTRAVQNKLRVVDAFLSTHTSPAIAREEGSNIATVHGLDLLAALIIIRVDYEVENSSTEASLEDAGDMIVAHLDAGGVSVDFDKTCDAERAVQARLAGRGTGLEDDNLLEVEIEMLVAKRKELLEDEEPGAGFRVYGERTEEGAVDGASPSEDV